MSDAEWIEKNAVRVLQYLELMLQEPVRHVLGEAGADKEYAISISDRAGQRVNIQRKKKLHQTIFDLFHQFVVCHYCVGMGGVKGIVIMVQRICGHHTKDGIVIVAFCNL